MVKDGESFVHFKLRVKEELKAQIAELSIRVRLLEEHEKTKGNR